MSPSKPDAAHPGSGPPGTPLAGLFVEDPARTRAAARLADSLGLGLLAPDHPAVLTSRAAGRRDERGARSASTDDPTTFLAWGTAGLEVRGPMGTLRVDFLAGRQALRVRHGAGRREPLARALGLRSGTPTASVLDATAGLGRDALLLASLGVDVLAVERHPVVGALLRDGLLRGALGGGPTDPLTRIRLLVDDARFVLEGLPPAEAPDAVSIDPMFPPRRKSSLVKKEMRIVADLVGGAARTDDVGALLATALRVARRRVVMKRPADAPPFAAAPRPPDFSTPGGRTTCYDVWLREGPG